MSRIANSNINLNYFFNEINGEVREMKVKIEMPYFDGIHLHFSL